MTIKEIAELAEVSVSTVSKIMNNKDSSIRPETRERVLKIAKEYHYTPYASAAHPSGKTWTIGIIMQSPNSMDMAMNGILKVAQERGYSLLLFDSQNNAETELKNIAACCAKRVDGVLWEPLNEDSLKNSVQFDKQEIPYQVANVEMDGSHYPEYYNLGYAACEEFLKNQHTNIGCLILEGRRTSSIIKGCRTCLFDHNLPFDESNIFTEFTTDLFYKIQTHTLTALICSHFSLALDFYHCMQAHGYHIPSDVSLISMRTDIRDEIHFTDLSTYAVSKQQYGISLCNNFINRIEQTGIPQEPFSFDIQLSSYHSIGLPYEKQRDQILVIGSINMDVYINVDKLPTANNVMKTPSSKTFPGGKAINQAVGVKKLGFPVSIMGNVGNDVQSDQIYNALAHYQINSDGIRRDNRLKTGHAYILLEKTGNSIITILEGANSEFSPSDILDREYMFHNTKYCLIQSEISMESVHKACELAHLHGAKTILKPSACASIPDETLKHVDILVPNADELFTICKEGDTIEEKSQYLLSKGVGCVIVTLGPHGAYCLDKHGSRHYDAIDFPVTDSTGASDAFIAALAVYLMQGYTLDASIRIASVAAAFSVMQEGVITSMVNKSSLESYLFQNMPELFDAKEE